jgi:hypothetical protein
MSMTTHRFARLGAVAVAVGVTLAVAVPGTAQAASKFANKAGFDHSKRCDAIVGVSDETSSGKVEVFGGFSCPTGSGLFNQPEPTTIRVKIFRGNQEVIQSKKNVASCKQVGGKWFTCSSDSHQVTYPDATSSNTFYGQMEITSFSGSVTLTTGKITT